MTSLPDSILQAFRSRRPSGFLPVALGYRTVELIEPDNLADAQVGYAVDASGRSVASDKPGAWAPQWLVVAGEDELGDPIFVDTRERGWPVLTAPHGEGHWQSEQIADSFDSFIAALDLVRRVARGRETPVARESNPISDSERAQLLQAIATSNPRSSSTFWDTWLEE